jgi:RecA-family ATPase
VTIGSSTWAPEAEQSLLGAWLLEPGVAAAVAPSGLAARDFFDERNARIFDAIQTLQRQGTEPDIVSVFELLRDRGHDERCGGLQYINELAMSVATARAAPTHAALIVEKSRRRRVAAIGQAIEQAMTGPLTGDELRARIEALSRELARLTTPQVRAPSIPVEWAHELAEDLKAPRQIVEGVLLAGGMSMMFGESNSGKSYLAIHLAIRVSLGLPWLGKRTQRGAVLYVAAEGAWSIRTRLAAYVKHYGGTIGTFGLIPCALTLADPSADVENLVDLIKLKAAELCEPVVLVVIDTVARVMGGGDENSAQDMGRLVSAGDHIREQTGAHLLYIHHAGKDASRGARGHSSLRAALDTEIEVTADESTKVHTAKITKQRDLASKGEKLAARFVPVDLGVDQWENQITACAVVDAEVEEDDRPRRMTAPQQAVLGYLTGRDSGTKRRAVVDALVPNGIAQPSVYRAINELVQSGLVVLTAGQLYVPKG